MSQPAAPKRDLTADRAADFEEGPQVKIARLERALADERKFSVRATRQLHREMSRDLKDARAKTAAARQRAKAAEDAAAAAERRAAEARRRAEAAEAELAELRGSTTWRAGRAVVALPARVRAGVNARRGKA